MDQVEKTLSEHPLLLLPDLDDSLPTELYEDVVDILDPTLIDLLESGELEINSNSLESWESYSTTTAQSSKAPDYSALLQKRHKVYKTLLDTVTDFIFR